jgi:hypothetical protein
MIMKIYIMILGVFILTISGCDSGSGDSEIVDNSSDIREMTWDQAKWGKAKWN